MDEEVQFTRTVTLGGNSRLKVQVPIVQRNWKALVLFGIVLASMGLFAWHCARTLVATGFSLPMDCRTPRQLKFYSLLSRCPE